MLISDVQNKDEITALIITELKDLGVKYRKEKKSKPAQEKCGRKKIFKIHLHLLDLTDVILANGGVVQIPQFVAEACQRILENVQVEGIFRKAGSSLRQKEIKNSLEAGLTLGKNHHIIDVANVVKLFFRELPEPLLSQHIQESLLRALLIGEERIKAILMTCLLLPPLTINTLAFFMQFLKTVADNSSENKMSVENLAIIFTPGLMPFWDISSIRFKNHVKVIQILIENANNIGVLPDSVVDKILEGHEPLPGRSKSVDLLESGSAFVSKKKKRRSGSLTRMFNGLKKIVGNIGSADNLDSTNEHNVIPEGCQMTPCLSKSTKKRKIDPIIGFSAKKKKDLMAMMSENGGILPNTPLCVKETKKSRLSLGGRKNLKYASNLNIVSSMERRWSIVGTGWSKNKKNSKDKTSISQQKSEIQPPLSPVLSLPCVAKIDFSDLDERENNVTDPQDVSYVRIPKDEYEDIKERVFAIETRLSQEFGKVRDSLLIEHSPERIDDIPESRYSGAEKVFTEFQRTIEQTEIFESSPTTDRLAKRLSRELKIRRRSIDNERICRSPSARKIGTIRRRSRETVRLSRNNTWHITNSNEKRVPKEEESGNFFYPKSNLKRGRPNTMQSGLPKTPKRSDEHEHLAEENWTSGEQFFKNDENCLPNIIEPLTPVMKKRSISPSSTMKTPMLPPKSIPRRPAGSHIKNTPSSAARAMNRQQYLTGTSLFQTPVDPECNGRASIARLRTQNAGQVMAKAKLFDGMGETPVCASPFSKSARTNRRMSRKFDLPVNNSKTVEARRQSRKFSIKIEEESINEQQRTPRRKLLPKSPGCVQKRQRANGTGTKYPQREILEQMVNENSNIITNMSSPRPQVPNIKKSLRTPNNNSPRRIKTPHRLDNQNMSRRKTPMKVTTPIGLRNSPRFTNRNARHF